MVSVIFFGIMLLGISIMGLWSGRQERLRSVKVREAMVYRRRRTRGAGTDRPFEPEVASALSLEALN